MRSLIVCNIVSLDGYYDGPGGDVMALPFDRGFSRLDNAIDKVLVSDRLTADQTAPLHNTRILSRAEAHEEIAELERGSGRDILVFGSHTLWNDLLAHGLSTSCT